MTADLVIDPDAIQTRAQFAAALTGLRERRGLTVRELARRLEIPAGTLGGYFSGRHVPSSAQLPVLHALLRECGVTEGDEQARWVAALSRVRAAADRRITHVAAPYLGLRSFQPDDAALFFGRDAETAKLLRRVRALRKNPGPSGGMLAVVGPSGSGKSSLLRAGLVAAVRSGRLDGQGESWTCANTTPAGDLSAAISASGHGPHLLVIDQFEEIFTGDRDPLTYLQTLSERDENVLVVLGLRADFYTDAAREPILRDALQHGQLLLGPMDAGQLREAIVSPAQRTRTPVEDGLVELIFADLAPHDASGQVHDPGALPLLSHALLMTWNRAGGRRLTIADYRASGGIAGAVQRSAEQAYGELSEDERTVARQLFLRLVNIDDNVTVSRRRAPRSELDAGTPVLDRFVDARLVTAGAGSVEITHEALLSAWPRLRDWIEADRAGLRLHRQLTDAANAWEAAERDPALLARGGRLAAFAEWTGEAEHREQLNSRERDFVDAAVAQAEDERHRERRRSRRLAQLLAATAVLAVAAALLAGFAISARSSADHARADALSRQVAFQSRALQDTDPALAQQLALVAYRIAPTDTARSAVLDASARPVITRILGVQGPTPLAVSSDDRVIAVGHADNGSVHLYALRTGHVPARLGVLRDAGDGTQQVFALAFAPDGRTLAVGGLGGHVHVWDVADPRHPRSLAVLQPAFGGAVESIAFSPDGRTVVAGSSGPHPVQRWTLAGDRALRAPRGVPASMTVQSVAFSPDGRTLAVAGTSGSILTWPAADAASIVARAVSAGTATVNTLQFSHDSRLLYTGDQAGVVTVWSTDGNALVRVHSLPSATNAQVNVLAVSPDGRELATGSSDNTVRQWDTSTWTTLASTDHPGPVTGLAYAGGELLSTAADGTLRLWPADAQLVPVGDGSVFSMAYSGTRLLLAVNGPQGGARLWDLHDPARPIPLTGWLRMPAGVSPVDGSATITANGNLAVVGNSAGQAALWNLHDPAQARLIGRPFAAATALIESFDFSPDDRLLAVGSDDATARIWDVSDPGRPRQLSTMHAGSLVLNVAFGAGGRLLAVASADDHAYLWDVHDPAHPRLLARLGGFANYAYGVAFSPDGRLLAVSSADHTTRMWDITDPSRPIRVGAVLTGPSDYAYSDTFSNDGRLLAVASNDHTVWVYDVHDPRHPSVAETLRAVDGNVFAVAFSSDDRTLVAGGRSPTLAVWTVDPGAYATRLCAGAGDPITRAEWAQYVPGAAYDPPCR